MKRGYPPLSILNLIGFTIKYSWTDFIGNLMLKLAKIGHGKNIKFYGKPIIHLLPGADIQIGDNCRFRSDKSSNFIGIHTPCIISTISENAKIHIGKNCGFSGTVIGASKEIYIGDNVRCGANCVITDSDWHPEDIRSGKDSATIIGDNVWLGYGVIVLKGVEIGNNTVIGAGSVVTHPIPSNVIAAGNPCKVVREIIIKD